jgi:nitroreductase
MTEREPLDVLEAIHSTPAMRYLKRDPIPDEVVWEILDAAIRAPSGTNTQRWGWIVVRDPAVKSKIAELYRDGWRRANRIEGDGAERTRDDNFASNKKGIFGTANYNSVEYLADHFQDAPVLIIPVSVQGGVSYEDPGAVPEVRPFQATGSLGGGSIYGAVQNLQLAARAFGVGTTYTSVANSETHEPAMRALLGLPENTRTMAIIPLGYPLTAEELAPIGASPARARFFKPRRIPIEEVTHWEQWGAQQERTN